MTPGNGSLESGSKPDSAEHPPTARSSDGSCRQPVQFDAFDPYVCRLEGLASSHHTGKPMDLSIHLDGEAGRQLRSVVPIDDLRQVGAFFTGESLAAELLQQVPNSVDVYVDPACGCGDLLLAASACLPVVPSLEATLRLWNQRIIGRDRIPEFIRAARARLALAAISRGAYPTEGHPEPAALLDSIAVGDGLKLRPQAGAAVLVNPPYGRVQAPKDRDWTAGQTTEAAVFLDTLLDRCSVDVHIAAVLPEVLRAGSRYERFRAAVEKRLSIAVVEPAGVFDALTDVDVFLLSGKTSAAKEKRPAFRWTPPTPPKQLDEISDVRVGSVVANRDPHLGPWQLYVDARDIGGKSTLRPTRHRRFKGTVIQPPFVAVGRTNRSNVGNAPRVHGTVVVANQPVAVENHLLVVIPKKRTQAACREIVKIIESQRATNFLDERLRCRHLTVSALREVPR